MLGAGAARLAVAAEHVDADERAVEGRIGGLHQVVVGVLRVVQGFQTLPGRPDRVSTEHTQNCNIARSSFQTCRACAWGLPKCHALARPHRGAQQGVLGRALPTNSNSVRRFSGEGAVTKMLL